MRLQRSLLAVVCVLLATALWSVPTRAALAQEAIDMIVTADPAAAIRSGPGSTYRRSGIVFKGARVTVLERNAAGSWLRVRHASGLTGWMSAQLLRPVDASDPLPPAPTPTPVAPGDLPAPAEPAPEATAAAAPARLGPAASALRIGARSRDIFKRGQAMGNRPNVFSIIGDSLSTVQPFVRGFGKGEYELGPYQGLQTTIDYFSFSPREGTPNSFVAQSKSATLAFNAAAALDPSWTVWTDKAGHCQPNETPIACEFRVSKPSVAIVLLGPEDVQIYDAETYRRNFNQMVERVIAAGVIPVLTTFPNDPGNEKYQSAQQFNAIVRATAALYGVPLIELRDWAMTLPDYGVQPDGIHLSDVGPAYNLDFAVGPLGGCRLRNLLTLQMLDALRQNVLTR